jgi:hypothetical protein
LTVTELPRRPQRTRADPWMPTIVELLGLAADPSGLWVISRNPEGDPDAWRSPPITRRRGRDGTIRELLAEHHRGYGEPWVHGTSDREDALIDVPHPHPTSATGPYLRAPGAVLLTNVAVIGSHGDLGPFHPPMTYVPEVFPWAVPLGPEDARVVGRPAAADLQSPPRPRYIDVFLHCVRHLSLLLGVRGPDGAWVVEPDTFAAAQLDEHWHAHLGPMRRALAGWYAPSLFDGPQPGQRLRGAP